jgi:hypothetical protein
MSLVCQELCSGSSELQAREIPLFVGLECEIESIVDHSKIPQNCFTVVNDGSLRNNGYEYVSIPMTIDTATTSFRALHSTLVKGPDAFTNRTSIHVHANCLNLDMTEVRQIILLYALFEEAFFMMVSPARRNNIHCVALTETPLTSYYKLDLSSLIGRWSKYTALNIKPLTQYGTIEFRHMHGTSDLVLVTEWLNLINNLFNVGKRVDVGAISLNKETIKGLFNQVFVGTRLYSEWENIYPKMDNQIIDIKLIG